MLPNDVSVPPRASLGANKAPLAVGLFTRVVVAMKLTFFGSFDERRKFSARRSSLSVGGPNPWYPTVSQGVGLNISVMSFVWKGNAARTAILA